MKQSTKLLSLVLALVMAFSCMTVIGNATLAKGEIIYDSIDDAAPELSKNYLSKYGKIINFSLEMTDYYMYN